MPSSQTFLRELFIRSGDIPVAGGKLGATGISPFAGLAPAQPLGDVGLAPAKPSGDAGLIDLIAIISFQHADRSSSRQITAATGVNDRNCPSLQDSESESYFPAYP